MLGTFSFFFLPFHQILPAGSLNEKVSTFKINAILSLNDFFWSLNNYNEFNPIKISKHKIKIHYQNLCELQNLL